MSSSLVASSCCLGEPRESAHYVSSALRFYKTHLDHVTSPPLPDQSPRISLKSHRPRNFGNGTKGSAGCLQIMCTLRKIRVASVMSWWRIRTFSNTAYVGRA